MPTKLAAKLRALSRTIVYRTPLHRLRRMSGRAAKHRKQAYWDAQLASRFKPYLGGTVSIALRDAVTTRLMLHAVPGARGVLDVGCASGTLGRALRDAGVARYVGLDISPVAIESADRSLGEFHVGDLASFPVETLPPFDVVVFNEVLYYLDVDEAVRQLERYARRVAVDGALVFSMKRDAKSRAILDAVVARFEWIDGAVFQEQRTRPGYELRTDEAFPAYLVGVVRPRGGAPNDVGDAW